jgi:hypothetical protein
MLKVIYNFLILAFNYFKNMIDLCKLGNSTASNRLIRSTDLLSYYFASDMSSFSAKWNPVKDTARPQNRDIKYKVGGKNAFILWVVRAA